MDKPGESGFGPVYGVRQLKRAIQQCIESLLAQDILGGKFQPDDVIVVDEKFVFKEGAAPQC